MRSAVLAVLPAAASLAACTSGAQDAGDAGDAGKPAAGQAQEQRDGRTTQDGREKQGGREKTAVAAEGGTVGGPGSACSLPVVFTLAESWKPKAVHVDPNSELGAALGVQGGVTMVCEIDAKPAGHIGYLRVWRGEKSDRTPRQVLEAFTADESGAGKLAYAEVKAGDLTATEVGYTVDGELLDGPKRERAFAVSAPNGPVVIHLGGLDTQEHEAMLPAYELAKQSLRLGG
ncbi:lipoprotein [Streptomyces sp. NPDC052042]|uniref:lipoprotein n=1 Tax=Streptomyces sp. NPDC052042 TaxID=3365683 RepID=UPI0037CD8097